VRGTINQQPTCSGDPRSASVTQARLRAVQTLRRPDDDTKSKGTANRAKKGESKMSTFKCVLLCVLAGMLFSCSKPDSHENRSKAFYEAIQKNLEDCRKKGDTNDLQFLSAQLDVQLKLEEFLIRSREADHVKFTLFGSALSTLATAAVSVVTTLITLFVRRTSAKKNSQM
jgi:hypothetical protein